MQIQENGNTSQLNPEIQQEGTSAPTGTTGTQEVHTVPKTSSYSQKVLDFQGIAIGIKTLLSWSVVSPLVLLIITLGLLWFAVKHDDPSILAPLPYGLIPGTEGQAPLEPMQETEGQAPLEPTQETERQAPLEPTEQQAPEKETIVL